MTYAQSIHPMRAKQGAQWDRGIDTFLRKKKSSDAMCKEVIQKH